MTTGDRRCQLGQRKAKFSDPSAHESRTREEGGWRSARMEDLVEEWNPMAEKKMELEKQKYQRED